MAPILPVAYALVLILSGVLLGFFIMYWNRGIDDDSLSEFQLDTEQFRTSLQLEKDHSERLQSTFQKYKLQIRSLEKSRDDCLRKIRIANKLNKTSQAEMAAAQRKNDEMFEVLRDEKHRCIELQKQLEQEQQSIEQMSGEMMTLSQYQNQTRCDYDKELTRTESELAATERELDQVKDDLDQVELRLESQENLASQLLVDLCVMHQLVLAQNQAADEESNAKTMSAEQSEPDTAEDFIIRGVFGASRDQTYEHEYGGSTSDHSVRSMIFTEKPRVVDDLKRISGIAEKLERELNGQGVYTFEQIMEWDQAAIKDFSALLNTFQDRIERDNWVEQAGYLYQEKHCSHRAA